jgi:hypothetical protein
LLAGIEHRSALADNLDEDRGVLTDSTRLESCEVLGFPVLLAPHDSTDRIAKDDK